MGWTVALMAVSTAMSVAGAMSAGRAAQSQSNTQAEILRRQAERERQIGESNAKVQREKNKRLAAKQMALLDATGQDAGTGSALLVQQELAEEGEFNARLIENNAAAQISSLNEQRVLQQMKGSAARKSSLFKAGSALLEGGTNIAKFKP
jgi:hypothetical protein